MALSKEYTVTIKDYTATLNPSSIKFYVNDCLDLIFTLNKFGVTNANNSNLLTLTSFPLDGLTAELLVENSDGEDTIEATTIYKNNITFRLERKYTRLSGIGRMQIRLTDDCGCEIKIPEFEYEVKNTINEDLDATIPDQVVIALSTEDGSLLLTEDGKLITY